MIEVKKEGNLLKIGNSPQLIVDLEKQKNYIQVKNRKIPYRREVRLSNDLLEGKRSNVFQTAVNYYYQPACRVAKGVEVAEAYRSIMNTTIREIR